MASRAMTTRPAPGFRRPRTDPRGGVSGSQRLRRIAYTAALVALLPVLVSWASTMAKPSNSSIGIRTVEWLRDHGAAGIVAQIESTYYSLTAPSKGGPALRSLPSVGFASAGGAAARARHAAGSGNVAPQPVAYRPPRVAPLLHPALPGEGVW